MPKELFETSDVTIRKLIKQVEEGTMQLPEFQRDFVWAENKQKDLIASIHKGFPTGSLLMMHVDSNPQLAFRPIKDFKTENDTPKLLVLDGQQRVTSLVYTFSEKHHKETRAFFDIRKMFISKLNPSDIDLLDNEIIQIKKSSADFNSLIQNLEKTDLLPCSCIFNSSLKADLLEKYRAFLRKRGKSENTFLHFLDKLDAYFEQFLSYRLPSIDIYADADLDVVSTIFTKLNTQGQRLSAFDLCLAKYFKESGGTWQLKKFLEDEKEADSRVELVDDDGTNFLQAIALVAGVEHKKASLVKHLSYKHIQEHKDDILAAFKEMGKFFQEVLKCKEIRDIPYDTTIPPLSLVFKNWSSLPVKKRSQIQSRIVKWIIVSGLKKWYTEGTDDKVKEDKRTTIPYVLGEVGKEPGSISEPWILDNEFIKSSSGSRRTVLIRILRMNSVSDFISGNDPNEVHHIFPKKYLRNTKTDSDLINSILNLTLISKPTNASIGGKSPSEYILNDIIPTLMKNHKEKKDASHKRLRHIMEKHFIDAEAYKKLIADDYSGFLKARARAFGEHLKSTYDINFQDIGLK
jgi:hypothetical protein